VEDGSFLNYKTFMGLTGKENKFTFAGKKYFEDVQKGSGVTVPSLCLEWDSKKMRCNKCKAEHTFTPSDSTEPTTHKLYTSINGRCIMYGTKPHFEKEQTHLVLVGRTKTDFPINCGAPHDT